MWTITLFACNSRSVSTPSPPDPLHGSWRVISEPAKAAGIEIIWTIDDRHIVVSDGSGDEISRSEYRTDPSKTPKHIDMAIRDIAAEDRPGIYEIDGRLLRLAFGVAGDPRPTSFDHPQAFTLEHVGDRKR
ncbi:MAG TPA: TIGR03067 domain-containing protein [Tepidisphaeraceae bacterium]|nr:TIGR03067 domain-containing protein [Tepidisphaeraceae bacterium]